MSSPGGPDSRSANLKLVRPQPALRILLRRSEKEGQEFSIDTQREGAVRFAEGLRRREPSVPWEGIHDYTDDGIAGDDFAGRVALRRLMADVAPGDIVVCRDHFRLGRDAIDSAVTVRDLVRDRRARLFYYSSGQEVAFGNAIDAAMTFIQGVGAQMELEAIRSRTREALRQRVRAGRIAGGACFGYRNERKSDASGRQYTVAVVDEAEAEVVRWIFRMCLEGWGLKRTAEDLNRRGVSSPGRGRRGTRSWDPSAIREILRRERYIGFYVHGRKDRIKRGGKRIAQVADPAQVMRVPVPDWRIIDDATWEAVQAEIPNRAPRTYQVGRGSKHALAGIAKCDHCGGGISTRNTKTSRGRVTAYACGWHHKRGQAVCPVTVCQPADEVEGALVEYMCATVLTEEIVERVVADVTAEIERAIAAPSESTALEVELAQLRSEQKKYAAALAAAPDVCELVAELQRRSTRIRQIEAELAVAGRLPQMRHDIIDQAQASARQKLASLREALAADRAGTREAFQALFPPGSLRFRPTVADGRKVWAIHGTAHLEAGVPLRVTPPGIEPGIAP
jgi:site-specific DNA recombinase